MNLDNWTQPFKIAFKLGMFSIGWLLVLVVTSFAVAISIAILKSVPAMFISKKTDKKTSADSLADSYQDAMGRLAKAKNFKVVKDEE
jgi:hypothetical protein